MEYSDMTVTALLLGTVIPLLVGLITKLNASLAVKAVLNFGLSALAGVLVTVNETDFSWKVFLVNFALTWVISVATYYGLWKPTGTAQKVQAIAPDVGIG